MTRRVLANARRSRRRPGALHALLDLQPRATGPDPSQRAGDPVGFGLPRTLPAG